MKAPFWTDPNDDIEILEATQTAANEYGHGYGSDLIRLNPKHIKALQDGKMLAWSDSEYSTFVMLDTSVDDVLTDQAGAVIR